MSNERVPPPPPLHPAYPSGGTRDQTVFTDPQPQPTSSLSHDDSTSSPSFNTSSTSTSSNTTTCTSTSTVFNHINESPVDDINLEFFYKSHTITLLAVGIYVVFYLAFTRNDDTSLEDNLWAGCKAMFLFFLIIASITFPNGPFTRPHPLVWRVVFGLSVLYLMLLLFTLFQHVNMIKDMIYWFYPDLKEFHIDSEKEYGVNCHIITVEKIWNHLDIFAVGHFLGWTMKAMLIRHSGICWTISVTWEMTEMVFAHLLPNFIECWWDALILDVIVCNGLGIWFGLKICDWLEMRTYQWESVKNIHSTSGKLRRCVLQFTPASWTAVKWMDPNCSWMRIIALFELVIFWQVTELNTFFLKHIFEVPPGHPLSVGRICLLGLIVAPSIRQFYCYVTDTRCKRVGTQCWVFGAIMMTESMICVKFGLTIFNGTKINNIILWLIAQFILSLICVVGCAYYATYVEKKQDEELENYPYLYPIYPTGSTLGNGNPGIRKRTSPQYGNN